MKMTRRKNVSSAEVNLTRNAFQLAGAVVTRKLKLQAQQRGAHPNCETFPFFRLFSLPFPFNFLRFFKKLFSVLLNQVHVEAFARASLEDRTLSLWPRLSGKLDKREMQFSYVFL